jgi:tetratricopeptide (TPR) repeat protein
MEHLDGIDLADVLSHERRIEPGRACQIGIQICRALEAAHVAGVIHRDLKPENIFLVARDGQADFVKVLDFGIARSLGQTTRRLTNPGIAMGTPEYMSPEQALGGLADRRSDIYSVGALLYEMVTGAPPYGEGDQAVATRASKPPRSPRDRQPEVSLELSRIILRALEGRPDKRHQTMAQLEYDLTKSLWGRTRAVAELLGLPAAEARAEDSGGARQVGGDGRAAADGPSPAAPAPVAFSPSPARTGSTRAGGFGTLEPVGLDPTAGGSGTLRFVGSLAFLAAAAVVAVGAYKRLPWAGTGTSAAPQAAAAVAAPAPSTARTEAVTKQLELMLAAPLTFEQVPALEAALADLRGQGATAAAGSLAARSAVALERVAAAELDAGNIDRGVAHYKLALALDPRAQGQSQLVVTLRTRAEAALDRGRADESVRWARKAVSLAEADPEIHALLAAGLSAAHDEPGAAVEYGKALASRPHDPELAAALARVQRHLKRPPHAHRRMARRAPAPDETSAPQSEPAAPAAPADKDEADDAPALAPPPSSPTKAKESAPGEPASEQ